MFDKIMTVIFASLLYPFGFRPYDVLGRFKVNGEPSGAPVVIYTVMLQQNIEPSAKTEMMRKQIPAVEFLDELFTFDVLRKTTMRDYYHTKLFNE